MILSPKLRMIGAAVVLAGAIAGGYKLGAARWHSKYVDVRVEFAEFKATRAEGQLASFATQLREHREGDAKREAALQETLAVAQRSLHSFKKRLDEAEHADPTFADCLRMPVPRGVLEAVADGPAATDGPDSLF